MRVVPATFFRQTTYDINRLQELLFKNNEQMTTGLRINRASDDPVDSVHVRGSYVTLDEVDQYADNLSHAKEWLRHADSTITGMNEILQRLKGLAEQMSNGTYSGTQRAAMVVEVQDLSANLAALANTSISGDYVFSGSATRTAATSSTMFADNPAVAASVDSSTTGGFYGLGTLDALKSRSITITVDSVDASGQPTQVSYSYVDDYGRTVTGTHAGLMGTGSGFALGVGDGVSIYRQPGGSYTAGDTFTLTAGRNTGNEQDMEVALSWSNRMSFNYTLDDLFGSEGYDSASGDWGNLQDLLAEWAYYLERDDTDQDYYEAIPATTNGSQTTGGAKVVGDWDTLEDRGLSFTVQGPFGPGVPSATNPMTVTYSMGGVVQGTFTVTGTGDGNAVTLDPPGNGTKLVLESGIYEGGDTFDLTLDQYEQGQSKSQEVLDKLENHMANLLKYNADAGGRLNRLEAREVLFQDDILRVDGRLQDMETADVTEVMTNLQMAQIMYQAMLQSTAALSGVTLADFL